MKALKIIGSIIAAFALIIIVGSLFLPKKSTVERSIMINTTDSMAYYYVLDFNKFEEWSPWYKMEPTAQTSITGPINAVGATYSWEGKELGKGNFKITKLKPCVAIYEHLTFIEPFSGSAESNMFFKQIGDSTKVTWVYDGVNKGIVNKWMGLATDKMMGKDWESGLANLKQHLEK